MKLDGAEIKKLAPWGVLLLLLVGVALYARRNVGGAVASDPGGSYVMTDSGGGGAASAQLQLAELEAKSSAFGQLLDYNLGVDKLHTDQGTVLGLADRELTLAQRQQEIDRELQVDAQGRNYLLAQAGMDYTYRLEQGKTNAQKSIAKHSIFANLGGDLLKAFAGFL